jgi:hypothetical protein
LTFSDDQTVIQLSHVFVDASSFQLASKIEDGILYVEILPTANGTRHGRGDYCPVSIDFAIDNIDEDIKAVVFDGQYFQVKRQ